jgi:hypothetical protein
MTIPNEAKRKLKDKICPRCEQLFNPTGSNTKHCDICRPEIKREKDTKYQYEWKLLKGLIANPGVGKGGMIRPGAEHPSFTTGIGSNFQNQRKRIKEERRYCERCCKDLLEATRYRWCLHHIDHDRTNNVESNFELLCKRCHQIEHECYKAFGTCND